VSEASSNGAGRGTRVETAPVPPGAPAGDLDVEPERTRSRRLRIALVAALVVLIGIWAYALVYSLFRRDPERFTAAERSAVLEACETAFDDLHDLPPIDPPPTNESVAVRATSETRVFEQMLDRMRAVEPERRDAAIALHAWLDDWEQLLDARRQYAQEVRTDRNAELLVPVDAGSPIFVRMNNYAESKGLAPCKTEALGAEKVYALRRD
jgi:hypothetical protein